MWKPPLSNRTAVGLLLYTSILVDFFRGRLAAVGFASTLTRSPALSVVVVAELYAGVREGKERRRLKALIGFGRVLDVTPEIRVEPA